MLFTYETDAREERPISQNLFELLSSTEEWCALYTPVGEPKLKRVQKTPFGPKPEFEEIFAYEEKRLVAVNRPLPSDTTAEVYDHQNNQTYVIDNRNKKIKVVGGIREPFDFSGMGSRRFILKGTVDDIIQKFTAQGYRFEE